MNHCLKFLDEAAAIKAMPQFRIDGQWITASHTHALDPIGTLLAPTGKTVTIDGVKVPQTAPLAGWHCNLMIETLPDALKQYEIVPANQLRVGA